MSLKKSSKSTVGIVGAGVIGRLLALEFNLRGWSVTLLDQGDKNGTKSCSHAAAGILSPSCEIKKGEELTFRLGMQSLELWPLLLKRLDLPVFFQRTGSLVVAHPYDQDELLRYKRNIEDNLKEKDFEILPSKDLHAIEPGLDKKFQTALYFPFEGQIDNRELLPALRGAIEKLEIQTHFDTKVDSLGPNEIRVSQETLKFDLVIDSRGWGAQRDLPELRAVRGELIRLHAPDIHLNRPVRLLHPRQPIYVVPRPGNHIIIGATTIESEDTSPISVRSTLELLSTAFALNSAFSEARVIETVVGLRPAFPNHLPRVQHKKGLIRINGLYRHGFQVSPKISDLVCNLAETGEEHPDFLQLFEKIG